MGNKELSAWLAKHVMGWTKGRFCYYIGKPHPDKKPKAIIDDWHPPESILDAFQVVEKMIEKGFAIQLFCEMGQDMHLVDDWVASFFKVFKQGYEGIAETAALAICLAAKKAIESENE